MNMANLSIFFNIRNRFNFYFLMSFSNNGRSVSVCALRMCWFAIFLKWIRDSIVFNGFANFSLILFNPLNKIVFFRVWTNNCYLRFYGEITNAINIQIRVILIAKLLISQWQMSPKRRWGYNGYTWRNCYRITFKGESYYVFVNENNQVSRLLKYRPSPGEFY